MLSRSIIQSTLRQSSRTTVALNTTRSHQIATTSAISLSFQNNSLNQNSKPFPSNSNTSHSASSSAATAIATATTSPKQNWFSTAAATNEGNSSASADSSSSVPVPVPFTPTPQRKYQFFQNVEIVDGIAVIRFDNPAKKVNTISFALKDEAEQLWNDDVHNNKDIKGVVFTSAKKDTFIAGADIFDIQSLEDKQDVVPLIESAMKFFQHLKSKKVPLVCAIDGPALGGGLEWALWCDYRICTDSSKTKLGLPEVKLGLLPGFGGTQNLFPLVGLQKAMDMMLTGKEIRPKQAKQMGLVDMVVAPQSLEQVAIDSAKGLANGKIKKSKGKKKSLMNKLIEDNPVGRNFMWKTINDMIQKNTNGNYPAPFEIIDVVKHGLEHPKGNKKYEYEREAFAKLAATKESEALIGIFDGMTRLKKHEYGVLAHPVKKVAVMGAGLMVCCLL